MAVVNADEAPERAEDGAATPRAALKGQLRFSWIWLVPLAAAGVLVYVLYRGVIERGPTISISFESGSGLSAHQTQVEYKSVVLGTVEDVELAADMSHVVAKVRMKQSAAGLLTESARFWVVRPRFERVNAEALRSGLQTLVSGPYIALDPGRRGGQPTRHFKGLEEPPGVRSNDPGRQFVLDARELGSIGVGTALYYRGIAVGEVLGYSLYPEQQQLDVRVFVHAPYDGLIGSRTRFWNVSGFSLTQDAQGLRLEMQSFRAALAGGIAFDNAGQPEAARAAGAKHSDRFELYQSRAVAELGMHSTAASCAAYFATSLSGLSQGSDVTLFGQVVGSVTNVRLANDPTDPHEALRARVEFALQPERALGSSAEHALTAESLPGMISQGLHVVLETKSFVTGEKVLALKLLMSKPGRSAREGEIWILPSEAHDLGDITTQLSGVASKLNGIPFQRMAEDLGWTLHHVKDSVSGVELRRSLQSLDETLTELRLLARQARVDAAPALARLPRLSARLEQAAENADALLGSAGYGQNSDFQRSASRFLEELGQAARSVRLLADSLQRHPESILTGKSRAEER